MIYLDNAATTFPKPETVYETMDTFSRTTAGNPGRGGHRLTVGADAAIREARQAVATLFGVRDPERVIFTLNATDALNMAIKGVLRPGDHVITTDLEHNSVSRPLEGLAARGVITLDRLRSDDQGIIDPMQVREAVTPRTRMVAICHASNVLGVVQDAAAIAEETHRAGALLLLDAAQSAGIIPIDVDAMGIDLCAFPGHKSLLGPMGTGALIVRAGVTLAAWREGGTGGDSTSPTQPEIFPHYLEGGTPNAVGLAGLGAGVRVVLDRDPAVIGREERMLAVRFAASVARSARVRIIAAPADEPDGSNPRGREPEGTRVPARARTTGSAVAAGSTVATGSAAAGRDGGRVVSGTGLVAFTIEGFTPNEVATILDQNFGIAVRAGLHCAPYIHRRWGLMPDGTIRISAGPFTTPGEIDAAAAAILELASS